MLKKAGAFNCLYLEKPMKTTILPFNMPRELSLGKVEAALHKS